MNRTFAPPMRPSPPRSNVESWIGRSSLVPFGPSGGVALGELTLEGGDPRLHQNDVRVTVGKSRPEFPQILLQLREPGDRGVSSRGGPRRIAFGQLPHQFCPALHAPVLVLAV